MYVCRRVFLSSDAGKIFILPINCCDSTIGSILNERWRRPPPFVCYWSLLVPGWRSYIIYSTTLTENTTDKFFILNYANKPNAFDSSHIVQILTISNAGYTHPHVRQEEYPKEAGAGNMKAFLRPLRARMCECVCSQISSVLLLLLLLLLLRSVAITEEVEVELGFVQLQ